MGMSWQERMIEGLLLARQAGEVDFCKAWRQAKRRASSFGQHRPKDFTTRSDDPESLPFSSFFHRACQAEWEGRVFSDFAGLRDLVAEDDQRSVNGRGVGMRLIA